MRRLCTSDWQLADNARDKYRTDFVVDQLPKLIDKYKVDQLLVLGDLTEQKDNHPAPLVNEIVNVFGALSHICEVHILQGNHDFLHKESPFFAFLENIKNIHWFAKPEVHDNCLYLPHTRDYKKDWAGIDFKGHNFIFAHNIFTGVSTNTGHALSGISPIIFPKDAFVIAGDVHEPQTFGNVTYVGSPCLCDFGDNYQPRVLLLEDLNVKSIKVHGQQKRLIKVEWQGDDSVFSNSHNANDIVKIQVHIQMQDVAEWPAIRSYVESWAKKENLVVNTILPIVAYVQGERQKVVNSSKKTDEQYLNTFVKRAGLDENTIQVGRDIIDLI